VTFGKSAVKSLALCQHARLALGYKQKAQKPKKKQKKFLILSRQLLMSPPLNSIFELEVSVLQHGKKKKVLPAFRRLLGI
jgi:hypothetical protein